MDLFCPHCTRRVSVADDKAGLITNCPLCGKQFMAPSLAPPPAPKPPPPPSAPAPTPTYGMDTPPAPPPPAPFSLPPMSKPESAAPPPPPLPPGEYTHSFTLTLNDRWLAFVPLACLIAIFVLSFFTWHNIDAAHQPSLWGLAFDVMRAHFMAYTILMLFPTGEIVLAALVIGLVPVPPQLAAMKGLLNLAAGLLLGLTFLMLCIDYADANFMQTRNPITVPLKIAIRLQFFAMIASFALFWLHWRTKKNLPLPKVELRW